MSTMNHWLGVTSLAFLLSGVGGCVEYYNLEEACDDKVPGGNYLGPIETDAFLRLNCHRRLAGLVQARPDRLVDEQAQGVINYIQQNPDIDKVFNASATGDYLTQEFGAPGFTGANIFERLENVGYVFVNLRGTGIWELLYITIDSPELNQAVFGRPVLSGQQAIDEFMRESSYRQVGLQPSWVHGAYAEGELPPEWWDAAGWDTIINAALEGDDVRIPPPSGRVYYTVVLYDAPHLEKVDKPWTYPKRDQTQVPLYSWTVETRPELADSETGLPPSRQLSYPISIHSGSIDPTRYQASAQNPYDLEITAASIVGPEGPLETNIVHPGDEADKFWPSGALLRTVAGLYTPDPFSPGLNYTLYADVTTVDGDFRVDFSFTTATEDEGVRANQEPATPTTTATARQAPHLLWPNMQPASQLSHGSQWAGKLP